MSSCELPAGGAEAVRAGDKGSRIHRFLGGYAGIAAREYKVEADHHCGVSRSVLVGESGERTSFQVRYFEVAPGGFSTLERHQHEHVVVVMRGAGEVRLGGDWDALGVGDAVYVAPDEVHQLRNPGTEPFGFLCVVDAERDRPVLV